MPEGGHTYRHGLLRSTPVGPVREPSHLTVLNRTLRSTGDHAVGNRAEVLHTPVIEWGHTSGVGRHSSRMDQGVTLLAELEFATSATAAGCRRR